MAVAAIIGMQSCSSDDEMLTPVAPDGVAITLRVPTGMNTRAGSFGDVTKVDLDNLQWTVYEVNDGTLTPLYSDSKAGAFASGDTETVNLQLAKGKSYQVAFYTDNSANEFISYADGKISVDYSKAKTNSELEDAFIGRSNIINVTGAYAETVTLSRPFAQLNWGTDDLDAPAIQNLLGNLEFSVSVSKGLFSEMDVISGETANPVNGTVQLPAVASSALPGNDFPVASENPDKSYTLLCMNYLLTGDGTIDCSLAFSDAQLTPVNVSNAPVKANYRTNIYGSLITAPADFNINVDRDFIEDINIPQEAMPSIDAAAMTMTVSSPVQLMSLATLCNSEGQYSNLRGWTVILDADLDMGGVSFTPIGHGKHYFGGILDGKGHTISNLSVNNEEAAGLIGHLQGTVKDVNFVNADIVSHHWGGVVAGYCTDNAGGQIYNVNVSDSKVSLTPHKVNGFWDDGDKAGGIIGYMAASSDSGVNMNTIQNCSVSGSAISGYRDIGGICGALDRPAVQCSVENVTVTAQSDLMIIPGYNAGAIFGRNLGNASDEGCTVTNVTVISGKNQ